jgi:hypothetical protein
MFHPGWIARCTPLAVFIAGLLALAHPARADEDLLEPDLDQQSSRRGPVNLLPEAVAARVSDDRATATTWGGYDGAKHSPLWTLSVEARIIGRLVFVAGAGYTADLPNAPTLRPQIGFRAQLLEQAKHGIDGGVAVMYRQDLFTDEGGFFQGAIALERSQGRFRMLGNLLYGQDGEGDDHDGEARLAGMFEAHRGLLVGVDSRYRHSLDSTDPNRFVRARPEYELLAGPTASYTRGSWAVMAETGFSAVRTTVTQSGLVALAGVGCSCF